MGQKLGHVLLLACAVWLSGCQPKRDPNVLVLVIDGWELIYNQWSRDQRALSPH